MSVIEMGVPRVITKAVSSEQGAVLKRIGADVVYPERDMALRLGKRLISSTFLDYVSLCDSVEIRQIQLPDGLAGKSVEQSQLRRRYKLNMIAIEREGQTNIEIAPDDVLQKGDVIVVIGKVANIDAFENAF